MRASLAGGPGRRPAGGRAGGAGAAASDWHFPVFDEGNATFPLDMSPETRNSDANTAEIKLGRRVANSPENRDFTRRASYIKIYREMLLDLRSYARSQTSTKKTRRQFFCSPISGRTFVEACLLPVFFVPQLYLSSNSRRPPYHFQPAARPLKGVFRSY